MGDEQRGRTRQAFLAVLVVCCAAACSPSSSNETTPTGQGVTTTPPASVPRGTTAQDRRLAGLIVLEATDLPGVWSAGKRVKNDQTGDAQAAHCLGIPNSDADETAFAGSPRFSRGGVTEVSSRTTVYKSSETVQSDLRGSASPKFVSCQAQVLATVSNGGARNLHLAKTALPASAGSIQGFQLVGSFDAAQTGKLHTFSFDEIALALGRVQVGIEIVGTDSTIPASVIERATAAIARRLQAGSIT